MQINKAIFSWELGSRRLMYFSSDLRTGDPQLQEHMAPFASL